MNFKSEYLADTRADSQSFITELNEFGEHHKDTLNSLCKLLHNFKGNAQAVGFRNFSSFFHLIECVVIPLRENMPEEIDPKNQSVLEFYLSELISLIESYAETLEDDMSDPQDLLLQKSHHLFHFKEWSENEFGFKSDFDAVHSEVTSNSDYLGALKNEEDASTPVELEEEDLVAEAPTDESPVITAEAPEEPPPMELSPADEAGTINEPKDPSHSDANASPAALNIEGEHPNLVERYLLFKNKNQLYGISADRVLEVLRKSEITVIKTQDPKSVGMLDFNSKFVEIYDVFQPLQDSWQLKLEDRNSYFILIKSSNGLIGFPSQDIDQVVEFNSKEFYELGSDIHHLPIFQQIHRHENKNILILNPDKLRAS
ncbi:MAG: chemotaxis protein CheW [Bdellovibrionales bacterium]